MKDTPLSAHFLLLSALLLPCCDGTGGSPLGDAAAEGKRDGSLLWADGASGDSSLRDRGLDAAPQDDTSHDTLLPSDHGVDGSLDTARLPDHRVDGSIQHQDSAHDTQQCAPNCAGRQCGSDGCGGTCAPGCQTDQYCNTLAQCEPRSVTDLFLIVGQSNAVGYGKGSVTIQSAVGAYEVDYAGGTNAFLPLAHPTGRGSGPRYESKDYGFGLALASHWSNHGRDAVYVFAAVKGSALVEAADNGVDGDWTDIADNDGLYSSAVTLFDNAKTALTGAPNRSLGRVLLIWHQGETDALHAVSEQVYFNALSDLYQRFRQSTSFDAFFVSAIGYTLDNPNVNTARFIEIMNAQERFANTAGISAVLVSRKAMTLTRHCYVEGLASSQCGLMDVYHYKPSVYEALGADIALNGWQFVSSGARKLTPSTAPSAAVKCIGDTPTETAIIRVYNDRCYRCPSVVDLAYWVSHANTNGESSATQAISTICDDYGYPGWAECRRQSENATLGKCPSGWLYLPTYSTRCFKTCQV